ncbi:MAG: adenylate/guanylate cyclase domain-containing protein [Hyphomicrobiaceae bacterium]
MTGESLKQRLAAILAADVAGYSRLMAADERGTVIALDAARALFREQIEANHGRVIDMAGDSVLAVFETATGAVTAALAIQNGLDSGASEVPERQRMRFRIGVHLGEIIEKLDGTVYGDGVNIAARLEGLAEPGGIAVSESIRTAVKGKVSTDFEDIGEQTVKNISDPLRAFRVYADAATGRMPAPDLDRRGQSAADKPSIAVLPFTNLSGDPEQEYFSDGMAEDLITDLSKLSNLSVAARNSAFAFKGQSPDVREVARKLGVAFVLEGSVRKMGSRLRINAQLIDSAEGRHVWAERYDGDMAEIFDFQDRILADIVSALKLKLTRSKRVGAERKRTESVEAYDLYLKARKHYFSYTPSGNIEARKLLERAIAIDQKFAEAYTFLAMCYVNAMLFLWPGFEPGLAHAAELAEKAVAIAPDLAISRMRLGWVQLFQRKHEEAKANFERALSLEPENAEVHAYFAETLRFAGEYERANEHSATALRLDPLCPPSWQFMYGATFYHLGQYDRAVSLIAGAVERVPLFTVARLYLACTYLAMGRQEDAADQIRQVIANEPRYTVRLADQLYPIRLDDDRKRFLDCLRTAGLPES